MVGMGVVRDIGATARCWLHIGRMVMWGPPYVPHDILRYHGPLGRLLLLTTARLRQVL